MQEVSRLVLLVTEITLIHLDNPNHPGFPLCGEKATRLDESDSIVYFGYSFTCENCRKALQSCLDKFMPVEWDMIASVAEKHGFKLTFEMSPGSVFCSTVSPTIHLIGYRGGTPTAHQAPQALSVVEPFHIQNRYPS